MSSSFTYYLVKSEIVWLRVAEKGAGPESWIRLADIDEVGAQPFADGGKTFVRTGALEFEVPHRCSSQAELDIAVFELLERAA